MPLRRVKIDPRDPEWTFPYASRAYLTKIREYFRTIHLKPKSWKDQKETHVFGHPENRKNLERWASVPVERRDRVEAWFQKKLAEVPEEKRTPGKIRSLMGNATMYGRYILGGKRLARHRNYIRMKNIWLAYQEWEASEQRRERESSRARTPSKVLELG